MVLSRSLSDGGAGRPPRQIAGYTIAARSIEGRATEGFQAKKSGTRDFLIWRLRDAARKHAPLVELFVERAKIAARLDHPNLARIHALIEDRGEHFVVSEAVSGSTLAEVSARSHARGAELPMWFALRVAAELAGVLAYAHQQKSVHACLSPSLIHLGDDGALKICDFGVASWADLAIDLIERQHNADLGYVAPEVLRGIRPDPSADVFSLGVILWEMLAGQRLFRASNMVDTAKMVMGAPRVAPSLLNPEVPPELDNLILSAIAADKRSRPANSKEVHDWLRVLSQRSRRASREDLRAVIAPPVPSTPPSDPLWSDLVIKRPPGSTIDLIAPDGVRSSRPDESMLDEWTAGARPIAVQVDGGPQMEAELFARLAGLENLLEKQQPIRQLAAAGDFRDRTLIRLLFDLSSHRFTGRLVLMNGKHAASARCEVDFKGGAPIYVMSCDPEMRVPTLAVRRGLFADSERSELVADLIRRRLPARMILSERRPSDVAEVWPAIMTDRLQAAFRWRNGTWALDTGADLRSDPPFARSSSSLIFGGARKVLGPDALKRWGLSMASRLIVPLHPQLEEALSTLELSRSDASVARIRAGGLVGEMIEADPDRSPALLLLLYVLLECGAISTVAGK